MVEPSLVVRFEDFCSALRLEKGGPRRLAPFQRVMLGDFLAGCRESVALLPKGSGKTTTLSAVALYELLSDPGCEGAVCAASRDQAQLLLGQLKRFVENSPGLSQFVRMNQRQAINRRTGGSFRVLSSDVDTMDGLILSFTVADELHRWSDAERYSILLAGVQKRAGRLFGISTAGIRDEGLLWAMRERAFELGAKREGAYVGLRTENLAWHEWSLPPEADPRDLEAAAAANPAPWVTGVLLRERFESPSMTLADFRRFSCNQFIERCEVEAVLDPYRWAELQDASAIAAGSVVFAIDATMDRSAAAIGAARCLDGELDLVDCVESGAGIAWVLDRALELQRHHDPLGFVIDPGGPANTLIARLQEFGISVIECSMREVAQASTGFYDSVTAGTVRHRGSPPLNQSVAGAVKRSLAQSWAFDRRKALADPAPLMAAALALWGLRTHGPISTAAFRERFGD